MCICTGNWVVGAGLRRCEWVGAVPGGRVRVMGVMVTILASCSMILSLFSTAGTVWIRTFGLEAPVAVVMLEGGEVAVGIATGEIF